MNSGNPLAYFITWTAYGTHLQGAETGWRKYGQGQQPPQRLLKGWHAKRLNHSVCLLDDAARTVVHEMIERHCAIRAWHLWIANVRTNHIHVVVTANAHRGNVVRDQLKANCTKALREHDPRFQDRPVWTNGGDWQCVNAEERLHDVIAYVRDAQDRKALDADSSRGDSTSLSGMPTPTEQIHPETGR